MAKSHPPFNAQQLLQILKRLPEPGSYWAGFSGGADSTALLHALHEIRAQLKSKIRILHVNHSLHESSDDWEQHCREVSESLGMNIEVRRVEVCDDRGSGIEAEARRQRYRAVEELLDEGDIFLTAHHREDQAETLLLNLIRGSGVDGLAGMPGMRPLGRGMLARPLLGFSMASLRDYLEERNLEWLEDPSNLDISHDRNFLRHRLLPLMSERWPGVSDRIARSADLSRLASSSISEWTGQRLETHRVHPRVLDLGNLDPSCPTFSLLIRQWLRESEAPSLPARQLEELLSQCKQPGPDSQMCIAWQDWSIRKFDDRLWLQEDSSDKAFRQQPWIKPGPIALGRNMGSLKLEPQSGNWPDIWPDDLVVGTRHGGERLLSVGGNTHKALKDIFRELRIPPWLRQSIPLLYRQDSILAVGDFVVSHELHNWLSGQSTRLIWEPGDALLEFVHEQCHSRTVDPARHLR